MCAYDNKHLQNDNLFLQKTWTFYSVHKAAQSKHIPSIVSRYNCDSC